MAKHCTNCGHELRDTDKFCAECGASVSDGVSPRAGAERWEYCEIGNTTLKDVGVFTPGEYKFYAVAVHPTRGRYTAGEVEYQSGRPGDWEKIQTQALNTLITQLTANGWALMSAKGSMWFSYKLQRAVKS